MTKNKCAWLYQNEHGLCARRCVGKYCAAHNQQLKNGSRGLILCIKCGHGVRGKTKLCAECGGPRFREFVKYYRRKHNIEYDEHDFITGDYKKRQLNT